MMEYGYEYDAVLNSELLAATYGKTTENKLLDYKCLRSGRDALKAIAREYEPCSVWLPALSCDSMVSPFKLYNYDVNYYKLNDDYSVDISSLNFGPGKSIFLYLDYFGKPAIQNEDLLQIKESHDVVIIEDCTQSFIWKRQSTFTPDYTIASLRKWLPIPDGGLLRGRITKPLSDDTTFSSIRLKAQCMRHEYLQFGGESIKKEYRKIFSEVSRIMDCDEPSKMSAYSYELAKQCDFERIRRIRAQNAATLVEILSKSQHITVIQKTTGLSDLYVPFLVANRNEIQQKLSSIGIFNTIIWPLNDDQRNVCSVARKTEGCMLAAPCDQRYTIDDMKYIGKKMVRVVADVNK